MKFRFISLCGARKPNGFHKIKETAGVNCKISNRPGKNVRLSIVERYRRIVFTYGLCDVHGKYVARPGIGEVVPEME